MAQYPGAELFHRPRVLLTALPASLQRQIGLIIELQHISATRNKMNQADEFCFNSVSWKIHFRSKLVELSQNFLPGGEKEIHVLSWCYV